MTHFLTTFCAKVEKTPTLISRSVILATVSAMVVGCMATLSPQGAAVRPVTEGQKERACEFLTIITHSEAWGLSTGGDARSAMNKVRNEVAQAGGNAMLIISTNPSISSTTVTAEALKCDFSKISSETGGTYRGRWTAKWGPVGAMNSVALHPSPDGDALLGVDEWSQRIAIVAPLEHPLGNELFYVLSMRGQSCSGPLPGVDSPDDIPDDLSLVSVFRIVFLGPGERVRVEGNRTVAGAGVEMNVCGLEEGLREFVGAGAREAALQGWLVRVADSIP